MNRFKVGSLLFKVSDQSFLIVVDIEEPDPAHVSNYTKVHVWNPCCRFPYDFYHLSGFNQLIQNGALEICVE